MQKMVYADRMMAAAARAAIAGAVLALLLLALLHVLSPEFDPAWRVVSEYANGHFGWVLSILFACWAVSSWALAFALRPHLHTLGGKIGIGFLVVSGIGEGLAALFDINQPLHGLADVLGPLGFPIAAILISVAINRSGDFSAWAGGKKPLMWTAFLSVAVLVLMIASIVLLFETYTHAGGQIPADGKSLPLGTVLPHGVIALDGYFNRLLVVVFCVWNIFAASLVVALNPPLRAMPPPGRDLRDRLRAFRR